MAGELKTVPFTAELLPKVQSFDCGDEVWEREVSDWIKHPLGTGGALDELQHGTRVWLYYTAEDGIIGFGSLGEAVQRYPSPKDDKIPAGVITNLAIQTRFRGQPPGPRQERYSARILDHLIHEAMATRDQRSILVLYVHVENTRAEKFYRDAGFVELHKPYTDKQTDRTYKRMVLVLKATEQV